MKKLLYFCVITVVMAVGLTNKLLAKDKHPHLKNHHYDGPKIKLVIGDKFYELQSYFLNYQSKKKANQEKKDGKAIEKDLAALKVSKNYGQGSININIKISKLDPEFIEWLLSPNQQPKDGQLIIYDGESGKVRKTLTVKGLTSDYYSEAANTSVSAELAQMTNIALKFDTVSIKF